MTRRSRDDAGTTTPMIVALAGVLILLIAVVIDASAAYLQRQGLDNVADGAALYGADAAASGTDVYAEGLGTELDLAQAGARQGVAEYLASTGAYQRFPGLTWSASVDPATNKVVVRITAPLELPLTIPGGPETASISATGNANVTVDLE